MVQTLDECLIIIPKTIFEKFKFDEITCQKWDLYVVEYCLNMKRNNVNSYVITLSVIIEVSSNNKKLFLYP